MDGSTMHAFLTKRFPGLLLILLFASCAPMTTGERIRRDINGFQSLPTKDQAAVQRGELGYGMTPKAVQFVLGEPSEVYHGAFQRHDTMRWNYNVLQSEWYGNGSSDVYYPEFDPFYPGRSTHLELIHRPKRVATVLFVDGKLKSWERMR